MELTKILSDYDKVFFPNADVYTREGKKSLLQFQDRPKSDSEQANSHVVVMPTSTLTELQSLANQRDGTPESKSALDVLRFVRQTMQSSPGQDLTEIGDNLFLYVPITTSSIDHILAENLEQIRNSARADVRVISNMEDLLARYAREGLKSEKSLFDKTDPRIVREGMIEVYQNDLLSDLQRAGKIPIDEAADALDREFFLYGDTVRERGKLYLFPNQIIEFTQRGEGPSVFAEVTGNKQRRPGTSEVIELTDVVLRLIGEKELHSIMHSNYVGVTPRNYEQAFAARMIANKDNNLVIMVGGAGTGKTVIGYAASIDQVVHKTRRDPSEEYKKLVISKSVRAIPGESLGFKPGTMIQKAAGTIASFEDAHEITRLGSQLRRMMQHPREDYEGLGIRQGDNTQIQDVKLPAYNPAVEFVPFEHMRGRSIPNSIIYIDEVQNADPPTTKTIVSRAGSGSKTILTGDINQVDNTRLEANYNGLIRAIEHFHGHPSVALIRLTEVQRPIQAVLADKMPIW